MPSTGVGSDTVDASEAFGSGFDDHCGLVGVQDVTDNGFQSVVV